MWWKVVRVTVCGGGEGCSYDVSPQRKDWLRSLEVWFLRLEVLRISFMLFQIGQNMEGIICYVNSHDVVAYGQTSKHTPELLLPIRPWFHLSCYRTWEYAVQTFTGNPPNERVNWALRVWADITAAIVLPLTQICSPKLSNLPQIPS